MTQSKGKTIILPDGSYVWYQDRIIGNRVRRSMLKVDLKKRIATCLCMGMAEVNNAWRELRNTYQNLKEEEGIRVATFGERLYLG